MVNFVVVYAVDWSRSSFQVELGHEFKPFYGYVAGFVIQETEEALAIAQEYFPEEKQIRDIVVVPKCCIKSIKNYGSVVEESNVQQ